MEVFLLFAFLAGVWCTPPPTDKEATLMALMTQDDFTKLMASDVKDHAPLTSKRVSFKHKYVTCSGGHISTSHTAKSINVIATDAVSELAHQTAATIISRMIANMPSSYCNNVAARAQVGVFTKSETMSVYPELAYMADRPSCRGTCAGNCSNTCTFDGRKWSTVAGSGGHIATVVDTNVLCNNADPYHNNFNVLVHEFAHTIHRSALDSPMTRRIHNAYDAAKSRQTWSLSSYAMSTDGEYFAQGASAWFNTDHRNPHGNIMSSCNNNQCANEMDERRHIYDKDRQLYNILSWVFDSSKKITKPSNLASCV